MPAYSNTALAFGDLKDAVLYFDHIIPVNIGLELLPEGMRLYSQVKVPDNAQEELGRALDEVAVLDLLPPNLRWNSEFLNEFSEVNAATTRWTTEMVLNEGAKKFDLPPRCSADEMEALARNAANKFYSFVRRRNLWDLPMDNGESVVGDEPDAKSELVLCLPSLQLIDTEGCTWRQLHEFRRDEQSRDKLRRLRLFAYTNYMGKPKAYIEDDIHTRIADYKDAVKTWGFQTAEGAINVALTSKVLHGALAGTLVSALCGAPTLAAISAAVGSSIEIGRIAIEVSKQRLALQRLMRENPVSYISIARDKLRADE